MYVSEKQIESVMNVLREYEKELSDGYDYYCDPDLTLKEMAAKIIEDLNKVIYSGT